MKKQSAGILLYRFQNKILQVFLVHPGGPFWKNKDEGAWSIPKGEYEDNEDPLIAAKREFKEETGIELHGEFRPLSPVKQKAGKMVQAWAIEGDADAATIRSNHFEIEWPPKSGKMTSFPEVDKAGWFTVVDAVVKINNAQAGFIEELQHLAGK
jgi:predicted NUDIX family NTP pyrophosphohydrolase